MKKIKVRVWSEYLSKMFLNPKGCFTQSNQGLVDTVNLDSILLEYTGFLDSNKQEIYEGDIVEFRSRSYGRFNASIKWNDEKGMFAVCTFSPNAKQIRMPDREWNKEWDPCNCDGCMYEVWYNPLGDNIAKMKVIGNIYENSELCEQGKS